MVKAVGIDGIGFETIEDVYEPVIPPVERQPVYQLTVEPEVIQERAVTRPVDLLEPSLIEPAIIFPGEPVKERPADYFDSPAVVVPVVIEEPKKEMIPAAIGTIVGIVKTFATLKPADFKLSSHEDKIRYEYVPTKTILAEEFTENLKKIYGTNPLTGFFTKWAPDVRDIISQNGQYSTLLLLQKKKIDPMSFQSFIDSISGAVSNAQAVSTAAKDTWGILSGFFPESSSGGSGGGAPQPQPTMDWSKILMWGGIAIAAIFLLPRLLLPRRR